MILNLDFDIWIFIMLIGHDRIWNFLLQSTASNRLAHAYLFVGAQGIGKMTVALEFVKNLLCEKGCACGICEICRRIGQNQHPDILFLNSDNNVKDRLIEANQAEKDPEIKIEQIRQLQHQISLSTFCAARKIVIIDRADQMTLDAANCLLKTLEEPPQKSLLILISSNYQRILPTIISRCQLIKFLPVKNEKIIAGLEKLKIKEKLKIQSAVKFACGRPGVAIDLLSNPGFWARQENLISDLQKIQRSNLVEKFKYAQKLSQNILDAQEVLNSWLVWFRDRILENIGVKNLMAFDFKSVSQDLSVKNITAIKNILEAKHLLSENSFNYRLVLENLMLKL